MPINFPDSPAENDSFTSGGKKWIFNGTVWTLITANSYTIPTGEVTAAKIASSAVTEAKINDGAVTQSKLASGLSGITVTTTANRSAVIPSPFNGQFIFLTDTSQLQRWDGSAWVSAFTTVPTEAPTSLALVSTTTNTATISFSAGNDGNSTITNYQYALSTDSGSTYGSYTALSPADGSSPITITGLSIGATYSVKLKAVNALGAGSSESDALSFTTENLSIEYLVVAGGGAGGVSFGTDACGGGGGAGGLRTSVSGATSGGGSAAESVMSIAIPATYTVTVGAGGTTAAAGSGSAGVNSGSGTASSLSTISTVGGGGGSTYPAGVPSPFTGGSGGGCGGAGGDNVSPSNPMPGAAGTSNQGFAGGSHTGAGQSGGTTSSGGGGGAGGVGGNGTSNTTGGNGGVGLTNSISGSSVFYGGGGAGGSTKGSSGGGGNGGGGARGVPPGVGVAATSGSNGTNNLGGGGGGGSAGSGSGAGGNGGSGVVIVRYLTANATGATITGGTATTSGAYTIRTFTSSGSLAVS